MDGFNADPERDQNERGGVDEGGKHTGALVAEGFGVVCGAGLEVDGGKAEQEGEKVGGVVAGFGKKGERVGAQAGDEGDSDVGQRGDQGEAEHGLCAIRALAGARGSGRRVDMHKASLTGAGYACRRGVG